GLRRGGGDLRPRAGAGGARRAQHGVEDVLRLLDGVRGRAEHPDLPGLPRPAGLAAGGQRQGGRVGDPDRPGAQLLHRGVVPLRAEELLLPGHAEELPDLPVRRAHRLRGLGRRRGGRDHLPRRDRARAHGGGHREVAARRRCHRPDPRRRPLPARLQPVRRAPHRDRHEAHRGRGGQGPGGGPGVRGDAARPAARARRLRRPDGTGLAALRRERLAAALAGGPAGDADRDQERELPPQRGASGPVRDHPAGCAAGRRRPGEAGDPALAGGLGHDVARPLQGAGGGVPLLPRPRPGAGGAVAGVGRGAAGHAARAARRAAEADERRVGLLRPRAAGRRQRRCAERHRGDGRGGGLAAVGAQMVADRAGPARQRAGRRAGGDRRDPGPGGGDPGPRRVRHHQRQARPAGLRRRDRRRGLPGRGGRAARPGRRLRRGGPRLRRRRGHRRQPGRRRQGPLGQGAGRRRADRRRDEADAGQGRAEPGPRAHPGAPGL
ncbi:MAG: Aspartyl-tRNA(Asn) amidotransferase subunit B @ Glutamyl-tRNA(Gln) amidotransferase subunit B, partial [uncultured Friedmanniella sp.]